MPLDSDLLRTFLAIADTGSVTAGAARIARSQSATSLQIKQLESVIGRPVFRRHGRGVALTPEGEKLLPVARRVTETLDSSLADLRGESLRGRLRIGIREDHGGMALTRIIADFGARHADVDLQIQCALGATFPSALSSGALDLAVFEVPEPEAGDIVLRSDSLIWMRSRGRDFADADPLPVAVFDLDCWWRDIALASLDKAGRRYRIVFTSESVASVRAAVRAGMAVGLLNAAEDTFGLIRMTGLDSAHRSHLVLRHAPAAPAPLCTAMAEAIEKVFTPQNGT